MRFMSLWMPAKTANPPTDKMQAEMMSLIADMKGAMVMTGGWDPNSPCTTQVAKGGDVRTIDGPYAETKEMIGGFAVMECKDQEEALAWGKRFLAIAGDGVSELRQLYMNEPPPKK